MYLMLIIRPYCSDNKNLDETNIDADHPGTERRRADQGGDPDPMKHI